MANHSMWGEQQAIDALKQAGVQGDFKIGQANYYVNKVMDEGQAGLQSILNANKAVATTPTYTTPKYKVSSKVNDREEILLSNGNKAIYENGQWRTELSAANQAIATARDKSIATYQAQVDNTPEEWLTEKSNLEKEWFKTAYDPMETKVSQYMLQKGMGGGIAEELAALAADYTSKAKSAGDDWLSSKQSNALSTLNDLRAGKTAEQAAETNTLNSQASLLLQKKALEEATAYRNAYLQQQQDNFNRALQNQLGTFNYQNSYNAYNGSDINSNIGNVAGYITNNSIY